jgi:transposase
MTTTSDIRVSVDVGCRRHSVAIGLPSGQILDEFDMDHRPEGFNLFFQRIEDCQHRYGGEVSVAMEGYNGWARPLDTMVRSHGYRLFNINNLKLARFKEIFPAAAKSDRIDARKGLELFQLREQLPMAKRAIQEVVATPHENDVLKRLTRRRRALVDEKSRVLSRMQGDLQAVCPGLLDIAHDADNVWFLNFITHSEDLGKLGRLQHKTVLSIRAIGRKYAAVIEAWQKSACFSHEVECVGPMIIEDARRILDLRARIKTLETQCEALVGKSRIAQLIDSIPGYGLVCSTELAGELGTIDRFATEASLAVYTGMANLDNSSGNFRGSKNPKHVNTRAKAAMMVGVDRHRKMIPESQQYYEKKRAQGKSHNQAIRALGRHLCRVIFRMLKQNRPYEVRAPDSLKKV